MCAARGVGFAQDVVGGVEAAEGLSEFEGKGAEDVWRALGDGLVDRVRQAVEGEDEGAVSI